MSESFSRHLMTLNMEDMEEEDSVLDVLREILDTDRSFHGSIRLLQGDSRNNVVAAHLRNTSIALHILRTFMDRPPIPTTMVMNIDLSGNMMRSFLDPVPVVATAAQITAGIERNIHPENETCTICRDPVLVGARLRACGHYFHESCIDEWLGMNTRCPVCRHDIREPLTHSPPSTGNEGRRVHPNEE